jgi:hypothetical protein
MDELPPALPHGPLAEVFPGVFLVTGAMQTVLMNLPFQFSRNMTVVRDGDALTIINSIRLDDAGLAQLEALGSIDHVVRLGSLHGRDDAFYAARYGAVFWAAPGIADAHGLVAQRDLTPDGAIPFAGCSVFAFRTTRMPECILRVDRAGGILIACDALQNLRAPDEYFSDQSRQRMQDMGFFEPANIGPLWQQINDPKAEDFVRLQALSFRHVISGHGPPLRDSAREAYTARFQRVFAHG